MLSRGVPTSTHLVKPNPPIWWFCYQFGLWFRSVSIRPIRFDCVGTKWILVYCCKLRCWACLPLNFIWSAPIAKLWICCFSGCLVSIGFCVALELCHMYLDILSSPSQALVAFPGQLQLFPPISLFSHYLAVMACVWCADAH